MKNLTLIAVLVMWSCTVKADLLLNAGFTNGVDGLDNWEAFDVGGSGYMDPSLFATASNGTAIITGYSANETAFYQTFMPGFLGSGTYNWQADISNIGDTNAFMFIKVFSNGDYGQFNGALFQNPLLVPGTMTLVYTHSSNDIVQFGFSGFSPSQGYHVSNLSLTVVPEPSAVLLSLSAVIAAAFFRRKSVR